MADVSLNNARTKAPDTRRMGDIKALQTAIEIYKTQQNTDVVPTSASWAAFGSALSSVMTAAPTDPTNTGVYTYVYCMSTVLDNKYLVAAPLEQTIDISGDLDTAPTLSTGICIQSGAATVLAYASIVCSDSVGRISNGTTNQTVFCLGQS